MDASSLSPEHECDRVSHGFGHVWDVILKTTFSTSDDLTSVCFFNPSVAALGACIFFSFPFFDDASIPGMISSGLPIRLTGLAARDPNQLDRSLHIKQLGNQSCV